MLPECIENGKRNSPFCNDSYSHVITDIVEGILKEKRKKQRNNEVLSFTLSEVS